MTTMTNRLKVTHKGKDLLSIEGQVQWRYARDPDTNHFAAVCPKLNITLSAESLEELFSLIPESMNSLFTSLAKHGDWDAFFLDKGWSKEESDALQESHSREEQLPPITLLNVPFDDLQEVAC